MAVYHYKAANPEGEVTEGEMEAQSRDAVIERLQALGYVPIRAEERGEAKADRPRFSFKLRAAAHLPGAARDPDPGAGDAHAGAPVAGSGAGGAD